MTNDCITAEVRAIDEGKRPRFYYDARQLDACSDCDLPEYIRDNDGQVITNARSEALLAFSRDRFNELLNEYGPDIVDCYYFDIRGPRGGVKGYIDLCECLELE